MASPVRDKRGRMKVARHDARSASFGRRLRFELLENRQLLSADLVSKAAFPSLSAGGTLGASSANGRYVAFTSNAESLSGFDIAPGVQNIYRFDHITGEVMLVSVNSAGTGSGNNDSYNPVISADGSVVAFYSAASNLHSLDKNATLDVFARNLVTGTTYLVSVNSTGTAGGSSTSDSPVISADGNVVAFRSSATNLHPLDGSTGSDIFARNLAAGTTYLVTVNSSGTGPASGTSDSPVISANGNVVAFRSTANNLQPLNTSANSNVFARNLGTGTIYLVSVNSTGTAGGNGTSESPLISADGNVVAFTSRSSNLHPLDTNTVTDVFARNLSAQTTYLVSINSTGTGSANGSSDQPALSADGSTVAFHSTGSNLSPLDTNTRSDIFARKLVAGTTQLVSINSGGTASGNDYSYNPAIDANGSVVVFYSTSSDLHPLDASGGFDAFARNLVTGTTYLVSTNSAGTAGGNLYTYDDWVPPAISADGSVVAFTSGASDLVTGDFNGQVDVFVRHLGIAATQLASTFNPSLPSTTAGDESSVTPGVLSADGRYVAFLSKAANLVSGFDLRYGARNVYRLDRLTRQIDLVSVNATGDGGVAQDCYEPVISADGAVVAFYTSYGSGFQVFARNLNTATTYLVSINSAGTSGGNGSSYHPVISGDGSIVAFYSLASNLHPLDTDTVSDIYARNLGTGTTYLVSVNAAGTGSGANTSDSPVISADGSLVAFRSTASNLHPLDTSASSDVFARNLLTGTTYLVSVNSAGTSGGNGNSSSPVISADGSVVAFSSLAANLDPSIPGTSHSNIFARNLVMGTTHLVSVSADGTSGGFADSADPVISADGKVVAFSSTAPNLHALDPSGLSDIYARNLVTGTTYLVSVNSAGTGNGSTNSYDPSISADGNVVAFRSSSTSLNPLKTTAGYFDVFARNLAIGTTYLISANSTGTGSGNFGSENPMVSADGKVVAFDSEASNLTGGDFNSSSDVFIGTIPTAPALLGDYNRNSAVDATDYVLWRKTSGAVGVTPYSGADGSGSGSVGVEDYTVWRGHFGATSPGAGALLSATEAPIVVGDSNATIAELGPAVLSVDHRGANFYGFRDPSPFTRRPVSTHQTQRPLVATDTLREDALLAWLSTRGNYRSAGTGEANGHNRSECAFHEQPFDDALNELFEKVASIV